MSSTVDSEEKKKSEKDPTKCASATKPQSMNFGDIIQNFLSGANTSVETSKFSIEKTEDRIKIDLAFTVTIMTGSQKLAPKHSLKVEERTHSMTPDKMDRTARGRSLEKGEMPYPLSEEEATPTTPESEKTPRPK